MKVSQNRPGDNCHAARVVSLVYIQLFYDGFRKHHNSVASLEDQEHQHGSVYLTADVTYGTFRELGSSLAVMTVCSEQRPFEVEIRRISFPASRFVLRQTPHVALPSSTYGVPPETYCSGAGLIIRPSGRASAPAPTLPSANKCVSVESCMAREETGDSIARYCFVIARDFDSMRRKKICSRENLMLLARSVVGFSSCYSRAERGNNRRVTLPMQETLREPRGGTDDNDSTTIHTPKLSHVMNNKQPQCCRLERRNSSLPSSRVQFSFVEDFPRELTL